MEKVPKPSTPSALVKKGREINPRMGSMNLEGA
jgi:hypothetical protein